MNPIWSIIVATLFTAAPLAAPAQDDAHRPPRSGSQTRDFNNDAHRAGAEVRGDLHRVAEHDSKARHRHAVARCNDGRYSYTHRHTCQGHGGIRTHYR